jgi:hypothetical protein
MMRVMGTRFWILDTRCRMPDTGYSMLGTNLVPRLPINRPIGDTLYLKPWVFVHKGGIFLMREKSEILPCLKREVFLRIKES